MQVSDKTHEKSDTETRQSIYEVLMKRMLFACESCDGALIQVAMCRFCKTTTQRKCRDCEAEINIPHRYCVPNADGILSHARIVRGFDVD
ncbi:hypothetical protein [Candidatus Nitrosotenuis uzonensis]|uniref:Uncharacterized protein n=1 Tax=Candidatus Nitrosotenuis uzonensis TaxID=1407055 RepID=V6AV49_9ARCH|nr:hypothetical protein [Candidatus Nitrosotenuis uzonensis]CDI06417.1 hypothetical protein NITUZ_40583 [Candidatus Nitrosotenuis uzonensis]